MAIINQVVSGGSSPTPSGKYQLLQRVTDDNNNEIGTVCGFHTDSNSVEYAIVCLDAQYRLANGYYLSNQDAITGLAMYTDQSLWESTDTATSNCTKILDYATSGGYTSTAVSHCRSKSFTIDGTTYYGQLPTLVELVKVFMNRTAINTKDTSASQYSSLIVPTSSRVLSSTQRDASGGWIMNSTGNTFSYAKTLEALVFPILELPNANA